MARKKRRTKSVQASALDWERFAKRHPASPFLKCDPLYSLTEPIITAVKKYVRGFFTPAQEAFERDLARVVTFGFFHHHAIGLSDDESRRFDPQGRSLQERHEQSGRNIDEMLGDELRQDGLRKSEIEEHFRHHAGRQQLIGSRQDAYVGWLVSNRAFVAEVAELRAAWGGHITRLPNFPSFPHWPAFDYSLHEDPPEDVLDAFMAFYRRWGLMRMSTWDWPVPMEPDLGVGMLRDRDKPGPAGVTIFIPWYILRDDKLSLQEVAQDARMASEQRHLWEWLKKPAPQKNREKGDIRFQHLLWIYRYHELVLTRRYGDACHGHVQQIDQALAAVLHKEEDTVKKLRLEIGRAHRQESASEGNATARG